MANPVVRPISPVSNTELTYSSMGEYTLELDDTDSSINATSVNIIGHYSTVTESTYDFDNKVVGHFTDTGANPNKLTNVDAIQYADNTIELTVNQADGDFNSAVFFATPNQYTDGAGFEIEIDISTYSTVASYTTRPYYQNVNFTGVSAGIYDFYSRAAIILLFNDSGSKSVSIAGPATDGFGTRVEVAVTFDWSTSYKYSILLDYKLDTVVVTATSSSNDETVLYKGTLSLFGLCLTSTSLANRSQYNNDDIVCFIANDGREVGDTVSIPHFSVYSYCFRLVTSGSPTSYLNSLVYKTRASYHTPLSRDLAFTDWSKLNALVYKSDSYDGIEFSSSAGFVKQHYSDLDSDKFFICVSAYTTENLFAGVTSGIGLDVHGGHHFKVRFLDGYIGVQTTFGGAAERDTASYQKYPIDIAKETRYVFYSDGTTFFVYADLGNGLSNLFSVVVSTLPISTETDPYISFSSDASLPGVLILKSLVVCTTASSAILPGQNSTTNIAGNVSYTIVSPVTTPEHVLFGNASGVLSISGAYVQVPLYLAGRSGITCVLSCIITEIIPFTPGAPYGPFLILNSDIPNGSDASHGLCLMVTKGNDGILYVYFPSEADDSREVAYQTNKGRSISFPVDTLSLHLLLIVDPYGGFKVLDYTTMDILLQVAAANIDGCHSLLPNPNGEGVLLPTQVSGSAYFTAALGVLDDSTAQLQVTEFLCGVGRGLNVSFYKNTDLLPTESFYGSKAKLLVTVQDND